MKWYKILASVLLLMNNTQWLWAAAGGRLPQMAWRIGKIGRVIGQRSKDIARVAKAGGKPLPPPRVLPKPGEAGPSVPPASAVHGVGRFSAQWQNNKELFAKLAQSPQVQQVAQKFPWLRSTLSNVSKSKKPADWISEAPELQPGRAIIPARVQQLQSVGRQGSNFIQSNINLMMRMADQAIPRFVRMGMSADVPPIIPPAEQPAMQLVDMHLGNQLIIALGEEPEVVPAPPIELVEGEGGILEPAPGQIVPVPSAGEELSQQQLARQVVIAVRVGEEIRPLFEGTLNDLINEIAINPQIFGDNLIAAQALEKLNGIVENKAPALAMIVDAEASIAPKAYRELRKVAQLSTARQPLALPAPPAAVKNIILAAPQVAILPEALQSLSQKPENIAVLNKEELPVIMTVEQPMEIAIPAITEEPAKVIRGNATLVLTVQHAIVPAEGVEIPQKRKRYLRDYFLVSEALRNLMPIKEEWVNQYPTFVDLCNCYNDSYDLVAHAVAQSSEKKIDASVSKDVYSVWLSIRDNIIGQLEEYYTPIPPRGATIGGHRG